VIERVGIVTEIFIRKGAGIMKKRGHSSEKDYFGTTRPGENQRKILREGKRLRKRRVKGKEGKVVRITP